MSRAANRVAMAAWPHGECGNTARPSGGSLKNCHQPRLCYQIRVSACEVPPEGWHTYILLEHAKAQQLQGGTFGPIYIFAIPRYHHYSCRYNKVLQPLFIGFAQLDCAAAIEMYHPSLKALFHLCCDLLQRYSFASVAQLDIARITRECQVEDSIVLGILPAPRQESRVVLQFGWGVTGQVDKL